MPINHGPNQFSRDHYSESLGHTDTMGASRDDVRQKFRDMEAQHVKKIAQKFTQQPTPTQPPQQKQPPTTKLPTKKPDLNPSQVQRPPQVKPKAPSHSSGVTGTQQNPKTGSPIAGWDQANVRGKVGLWEHRQPDSTTRSQGSTKPLTPKPPASQEGPKPQSGVRGPTTHQPTVQQSQDRVRLNKDGSNPEWYNLSVKDRAKAFQGTGTDRAQTTKPPTTPKQPPVKKSEEQAKGAGKPEVLYSGYMNGRRYDVTHTPNPNHKWKLEGSRWVKIDPQPKAVVPQQGQKPPTEHVQDGGKKDGPPVSQNPQPDSSVVGGGKKPTVQPQQKPGSGTGAHDRHDTHDDHSDHSVHIDDHSVHHHHHYHGGREGDSTGVERGGKRGQSQGVHGPDEPHMEHVEPGSDSGIPDQPGKIERPKMHPHINRSPEDVEILQKALSSIGGAQEAQELSGPAKEANKALFAHFTQEFGFVGPLPDLKPGARFDLKDPQLTAFLKKQGLTDNQIAQLQLKCSIEIKPNGEFNLHVEGNCGQDLKKVLERLQTVTTEFKKAHKADGLGDHIKLNVDPEVAILKPEEESALKNGGWLYKTTLPDGTKVEMQVTAEKSKFTIQKQGSGQPSVYEIPTWQVFEQFTDEKGNALFPNWESAIQNTVVSESYDRNGFWFKGLSLNKTNQDTVEKNKQLLVNALGRYLEVRVDDDRGKAKLDFGGTGSVSSGSDQQPTVEHSEPLPTPPQRQQRTGELRPQQPRQPTQSSGELFSNPLFRRAREGSGQDRPVTSPQTSPRTGVVTPPKTGEVPVEHTLETSQKWVNETADRLRTETMTPQALKDIKARILKDKEDFKALDISTIRAALSGAYMGLTETQRGELGPDFMNLSSGVVTSPQVSSPTVQRPQTVVSGTAPQLGQNPTAQVATKWVSDTTAWLNGFDPKTASADTFRTIKANMASLRQQHSSLALGDLERAFSTGFDKLPVSIRIQLGLDFLQN